MLSSPFVLFFHSLSSSTAATRVREVQQHVGDVENVKPAERAAQVIVLSRTEADDKSIVYGSDSTTLGDVGIRSETTLSAVEKNLSRSLSLSLPCHGWYAELFVSNLR